MLKNLTNVGVGGFVANYYWSSSEEAASYAWNQFFSNGSHYNVSKNFAAYVRPVRAF
jgi:hypothetical protein